jgi:hypothetical protein
MSIIFQKASEVAPGQNGIIDLISVSMSPQQFKALIKAAQEAFVAYESVFGQISIPDLDITPTRDATQIEQVIRDVRKTAHEAAKASVQTSSNELEQPEKRSRGARRQKEP